MANLKEKIDMGMSSLFEMLDHMEKDQESVLGSLNFQVQIKEVMTETLKRVPLKRWEIAGRMSDLVGMPITEHQLNAWTAESKEGHRFPVEYLPAWCEVTGDYRLLEFIAKGSKCYLVKSEEVLLLELAKIQERRRTYDRQEEALLERLKEMRDEK